MTYFNKTGRKPDANGPFCCFFIILGSFEIFFAEIPKFRKNFRKKKFEIFELGFEKFRKKKFEIKKKNSKSLSADLKIAVKRWTMTGRSDYAFK